MNDIALAIEEARREVAKAAKEILPDTCRLIVEGDAVRTKVPCKFSGGSGDVDGASYRIKFAWGTSAVVGAAAVIDPVPGRPQLTLQLVEPMDSSMGVWQEWRATAGPVYGRADVGL